MLIPAFFRTRPGRFRSKTVVKTVLGCYVRAESIGKSAAKSVEDSEASELCPSFLSEILAIDWQILLYSPLFKVILRNENKHKRF